MSTPIIACDPSAFSASERERYDVLREQVRSAAGDVRETEDGFALRFETKPAVLGALAEWIALERLCCPFLDFVVEVPARQGFATVLVSGPEGTKDVLREGIAQPLFSAVRLVRR